MRGSAHLCGGARLRRARYGLDRLEKASFILQIFIDPKPLVPALGDPQSGRERQTCKQIIIKGR